MCWGRRWVEGRDDAGKIFEYEDIKSDLEILLTKRTLRIYGKQDGKMWLLDNKEELYKKNKMKYEAQWPEDVGNYKNIEGLGSGRVK